MSDCVFEFDDYPIGRERCLYVLDRLKRQFSLFKCTVFAIPSRMTKDDWTELQRRSEWIQVAPHGFEHEREECWSPGYLRHLSTLDSIASDSRWVNLFKAGWYAYDTSFLQELDIRGFAIAAKCLNGFPYPMPQQWSMWNILDCKVSNGDVEEDWINAHPYFPVRRHRQTNRSLWRVSPRNLRRWRDAWKQGNKKWLFSSSLARPARLCINIGCGPQVWPGWLCLDKSPDRWKDERIVRWAFGDPIPCAPNRADIVFSSHCLVHVPQDKWQHIMLDIWRVLRPGGVWRLSEDDSSSGYEWRALGSMTSTGKMWSQTSPDALQAVAEQVGFKWYPARPGYTRSPITEVLRGDSRARLFQTQRKFYAECVKAIEIPDLVRSHLYDERARNRDPVRYTLERAE
jgi:SAM-dependent methyltransferase